MTQEYTVCVPTYEDMTSHESSDGARPRARRARARIDRRAMAPAQRLDPAPAGERSVFLLRCSRARLAAWIEAHDRGEGDFLRVTRADDRAAAAGNGDGARGGAVLWTIETAEGVDSFVGVVEDGCARVVRGVVRAGGGEALETVGTCAERLRPRRTLESGTARRVRERAEEELREKHERHVKVVGVEEAPEAPVDERVRRDAERWARVVAAALMEESGGESARLRGAIMALLHERPLAVNALRDSVTKGYAMLGKEAPSPKLVTGCVKQVAKLCPPGRYELLGHSKKKAQERHDALLVAARELKIEPRKDETTTKTTTTIKATEQTKTATAATSVSVPTPPLQEPPRVLRGGITVDLGDQSPSLDLEPHAHVVPRAAASPLEATIAERAAGDDDDGWLHLGPPLNVGVIESPHELEAVKATYDTKYAAYCDLHARLTANAEEYERVRRRRDAVTALERFASLRRERYSRMRDVFDALHHELTCVRAAIDAHSR